MVNPYIIYLTGPVLGLTMFIILVRHPRPGAALLLGVALAFITVGSTLAGSPYLSLFTYEPFTRSLAPLVALVDSIRTSPGQAVGEWRVSIGLLLMGVGAMIGALVADAERNTRLGGKEIDGV